MQRLYLFYKVSTLGLEIASMELEEITIDNTKVNTILYNYFNGYYLILEDFYEHIYSFAKN